MNIGRKIAAARALKDWTQEDLAKAAGYKSKANVSNLENSESISTRSLYRVSKALGMTPMEILGLGETSVG